MFQTPLSSLPNNILTDIRPNNVISGNLIAPKDSTDNIGNPELRKIAEDIQNAVQWSITCVAASPDTQVRPGSMEAAFRDFFTSYPREKQELIVTRASSLLNNDKTGLQTIFGRYAEIPIQYIFDQGIDRITDEMPGLNLDFDRLGFPTNRVEIPVNMLVPSKEGLLIPADAISGVLDQEAYEAMIDTSDDDMADTAIDYSKLADTLGVDFYGLNPVEVLSSSENANFEILPPQLAGYRLDLVPDKLRMKVLSVKCIKDTNERGTDEIALAGLYIDETGQTRKIGERRVGNKFRPGKVKRLDWNYHSFSLTERSFWPKTFAITFILAEKDHGGLSSFLQNLWLHVRVAVYIAIKKAADEAGKAIAAFLELPEIGPIIGKALSTVIRKIVDLALGWIFKLFGDEIFAPRTLEVTIPSRNWRFGPVLWGSMPSLFSWIYTERFTGFGGIYDLRCQWELYS